MVNPVPPYPVTTPFGVPGSWAAGFHPGEDRACPNGSKVVASEGGTVVYSGNGGGWGPAYGEHIIIDTNGRRHAYCHLRSRIVGYGARVARGQQIGWSNNTGRSTGPHHHAEERVSPHRYGTDARKPIFPAAGTGGGGSTTVCLGDYCYGKEADAHRALQRRLKEKGHDPGFGDWPTRLYGDGTKSAMAAFQRAQGWSGSDADGMPGPGTLDRLGLPQRLRYRRDGVVYLSKMVMGTADSDSVWNLQIALLRKGYSIPNGPTDYFGKQTKTAVTKFQEDQGWSGSDADGLPGPGTIKALGLNYVDDRDVPVNPKPEPESPSNKPEAPSWMPTGAVWDPIQRQDGSWVTGLRAFAVLDKPAPKITLHRTESPGKPNWTVLNRGFPHATVDLEEDKIWWHLPLNVAAYTLKGGEHSPNSAGGVNIQLEIVGYSRDTPNWSQEICNKLRKLLEEIAEQIDMPYVFPFPFTGEDGYGVGGSVRQEWSRIRDTPGVVAHSHWTYNDHWDVGDLPVERMVDDVTDPTPEPKPEQPTVSLGDAGLREVLVTGYRAMADQIDALADVEIPCDYEVKKGDTFWSLSQAWGVTVDEIRDANPGVDENALEEGDCLNRP